jgi:acetyl-CoA synthetase
VAGHRISNAGVEASAEKHPAIAAAAVVGKPDKVKGGSIVVFSVLKPGTKGDANLQKDIKNFIRKTLGPIAIPSDVIFVEDIPKNRAGKPVRPLIKAKALGQPLGDISSVANPKALDQIPLVPQVRGFNPFFSQPERPYASRSQFCIPRWKTPHSRETPAGHRRRAS